MATSIQDVAREAGVSISTVSRSFTRPDLVSAKTRERVLAIADKLNFSLSRSAAALKSGRSLRIAVLMSGHIRLWFTASVIEGLNEVLHTQGYDISVFQISSIEERKEFFEMLPVRRNADAVIVASFDIDNNEIAQLASVGVPIVGINSVEPEARGFTAAVTDRDAIIAITGSGKRELLGKPLSDALAQVMEQRSIYQYQGSGRPLPVSDSSDRYTVAVAAPILCEGDVLGLVLFLSSDAQIPGEGEYKLAQAVAGFLGKHMET